MLEFLTESVKLLKISFLASHLKAGESIRVDGSKPPFHCDKWHEIQITKNSFGGFEISEVEKIFTSPAHESELLEINEIRELHTRPLNAKKEARYFAKRLSNGIYLFYSKDDPKLNTCIKKGI